MLACVWCQILKYMADECFFYFVSLGAYAMGWFSKVMFSQVQGVVVKNGKPVSGASVMREFEWAWNDIRETDKTTTDGEGKFSFLLITRLSIMTSIMPHEPVIFQKITIVHDDKKYLAWSYFKHNYDNNGEVDGRRLNLHCELTREEDFHIKPALFGICTLQ
jgi:hypothetical protein